MNLPEYPSAGQPLSASWARQLLDYVRSITPRSSASVAVTTLSGGTTFAAGRQAAASAPQKTAGEETDILRDVDFDPATFKLRKKFRKGRVVWLETQAEADARPESTVEIVLFEDFSI